MHIRSRSSCAGSKREREFISNVTQIAVLSFDPPMVVVEEEGFFNANIVGGVSFVDTE